MKTDLQLKNDVVDQIGWAPSVSSGDIRVAAHDGIVTLSGTVPHFAEKGAAERAAQRVTGVKAIVEELEVNLDGLPHRSDADVAESVVNSLSWHVWVPQNVQATIENGYVTLSGDAEWDFQRNAAAHAVRHLFGVKGVSNNIVLHPGVKNSEVRSAIENTLERDAGIDAQGISVSSNGGEVTLTGMVDSWDQRAEAGVAAWSTRGVTSVANELVVTY